MPLLSHPHDTPEARLARLAQEDPWVMYLVVRSDLAVSAREALAAGAQAAMRCVEAYSERPAWREAFAAWTARSFRKVTLRAKGGAWARLAAYDAGVGAARGEPLVRALPPRLRSEGGPLIRGLQVWNPDPDKLAPEPPDPGDPAAMTFVCNPAAAMSVGKQLAQVAHAVLLCAGSAWRDDPRYRAAFAAWRAGGYPCRFLPPSDWAHLYATADGVVVRDAGLTEVAPGTETVLALPPGFADEPRSGLNGHLRSCPRPPSARRARARGRPDPRGRWPRSRAAGGP